MSETREAYGDDLTAAYFLGVQKGREEYADRLAAAERRLLPENVAKALFAIDPGNKGAAFEQMPKQYREAHIAEAGGFLSILSRIEKEGE
jgi:Zn-dependent protease with chaperone function